MAGGGKSVGGAQLQIPSGAMPSIGANGQIIQAGAMPTVHQNPAWMNGLMGALTGNAAQYGLGAPAMHQALQGASQMGSTLGAQPSQQMQNPQLAQLMQMLQQPRARLPLQPLSAFRLGG